MEFGPSSTNSVAISQVSKEKLQEGDSLDKRTFCPSSLIAITNFIPRTFLCLITHSILHLQKGIFEVIPPKLNFYIMVLTQVIH